jgi:hypothetical protein
MFFNGYEEGKPIVLQEGKRLTEYGLKDGGMFSFNQSINQSKLSGSFRLYWIILIEFV